MIGSRVEVLLIVRGVVNTKHWAENSCNCSLVLQATRQLLEFSAEVYAVGQVGTH